MNPTPSFLAVARATAAREFLSHRLNRFLHAYVALVLVAGFLPLLTPGDALARGAAWWLLNAVLYAISVSALLLGLSSAHAEVDEFTWLLGQPAGIGAWLAGKAAALTALVAAASALLIVPACLWGVASRPLALAGLGAMGVTTVCSLVGLAIGFWIRDSVRGLIASLVVWFVLLFGTDLVLLGTGGEPWVQAHPDAWVAPLMLNPLDAYRIAILFAVEHSAFTGYSTGQLTGWWIDHAGVWLVTVVGGWATTASLVAWLGARRRCDG